MMAWKRTFVCAFAAQVLGIVGFSFALPFLPFFIRDLGITGTAQQAYWSGILLAATGVTLAIFAPLWGMLADRYGRKPMVIRSMFGGTVVLLLMSFSTSVGQLLVLRLLQGALTGTISASVALVASVTPSKRSGFTMGMMQAAVMLGVAIGPLIGGVIADLFGYRAAFRAGALVVMLGGVLIHVGAQEAFSAPDPSENVPGFRTLMAGNGFAVAVVILFAVRFSNTLVNPSFPIIIQELLTDPHRLNSIAGMIMAGGGLAGAVSAALLGHVGDRIGHRQVVIACSLAAAVTSSAHAFTGSLPVLAAVHLLFGLSVAGTMPAANAMIQKSTDARHMGKAFGAASALGILGIALGPLTGGILARHLGLRVPFLAAGISQVMVAFLAFTIARRR